MSNYFWPAAPSCPDKLGAPKARGRGTTRAGVGSDSTGGELMLVDAGAGMCITFHIPIGFSLLTSSSASAALGFWSKIEHGVCSEGGPSITLFYNIM